MLLPSASGLTSKSAKEAVDLVAAVGVAEMAEEQIAVLGEEARNLGELRLVDVFVIAKAQVANRLDVDQLLHLGFKRADAGLQVGGHKSVAM